MEKEIATGAVIILLVIAGLANAIMDTLAFKYESSIFKTRKPQFWNPVLSSKNKYKDGDSSKGRRFFLSTTVLVFTTDAWHLFQFIFNTSIFLAMVLYPFSANLGHFLLDFLAARTIYGISEEAGHKLFIKKK